MPTLVWLCYIGLAHSVTMVNISGTIRATPGCILNNNETIVVNLGNAIKTENINGVNYKTPLKFVMTCKNIKGNTVKLKILGVATEYNHDALQTSIPDLGLEFYLTGLHVGINTWFEVDPINVRMEVVPIKAPSTVLPDGLFDAHATLLMDFL